MRLVTYGAACSLDGFIARPDGGVDWLLMTADARKVMAEFWPRIDTVLMGRKTWDQAAKMGGGGYPGVGTYVFSRTLEADPAPGVTLVRSDAGEFVRKLRKQKGKDICVMGGGDFARSLIEAGVVDEIGINVHPVLLGRGIPLFQVTDRQTSLKLVECRRMQGDCVLMTYQVRRRRSAASRRIDIDHI